jgi:hypothetical protein
VISSLRSAKICAVLRVDPDPDFDFDFDFSRLLATLRGVFRTRSQDRQDDLSRRSHQEFIINKPLFISFSAVLFLRRKNEFCLTRLNQNPVDPVILSKKMPLKGFYPFKMTKSLFLYGRASTGQPSALRLLAETCRLGKKGNNVGRRRGFSL